MPPTILPPPPPPHVRKALLPQTSSPIWNIHRSSDWNEYNWK